MYSYKNIVIVYLLVVSLTVLLTAMEHGNFTSPASLPKKRLTLEEEIDMLIGGSTSPCLDDEPPMSAKDLTDSMNEVRND